MEEHTVYNVVIFFVCSQYRLCADMFWMDCTNLRIEWCRQSLCSWGPWGHIYVVYVQYIRPTLCWHLFTSSIFGFREACHVERNVWMFTWILKDVICFARPMLEYFVTPMIERLGVHERGDISLLTFSLVVVVFSVTSAVSWGKV